MVLTDEVPRLDWLRRLWLYDPNCAFFRFLNDLLARDGKVPEDWIPRWLHPLLSLDPGLQPPDIDRQQPEAEPDRADAAEAADDEAHRRSLPARKPLHCRRQRRNQRDVLKF